MLAQPPVQDAVTQEEIRTETVVMTALPGGEIESPQQVRRI